MSLRGSMSLPALALLGGLLPAGVLAEEFRWNWALNRSYLFAQSIDLTVVKTDRGKAYRDGVGLSQQIQTTVRRTTKGTTLHATFEKPRLLASFTLNGLNKKYDSKDPGQAESRRWKDARADLARLRDAEVDTHFDAKGRVAEVDGLGTIPNLMALGDRAMMGLQCEAMVAFSTTFLPSNPVSPGDSWEVELPEIYQQMLELQGPVADTKYTVTVTFDKLVTRWKRQHASISYRGSTDLATVEDPDFPFARFTISGKFLWELQKGFEVESEQTLKYGVHPDLAKFVEKEGFAFEITSVAKQRLAKVGKL